MYYIWLVTIMLSSAALEFFLTRANLVVPVMTLAAFYVFSCYHLGAAIPLTILIAAVLDLALGRSLIMNTFVLAGAVIIAGQWKKRGDCTVFVLQAVPGMLTAGMWGVLMMLSESFQTENLSVALVVRNSWLLLWIVVSSALFTPFMIAVLDHVAGFLDQPQFVSCQSRREQD